MRGSGVTIPTGFHISPYNSICAQVGQEILGKLTRNFHSVQPAGGTDPEGKIHLSTRSFQAAEAARQIEEL